MTRQEAIEILNALAWVQGGADREETITAINMAIEALQAEPAHGRLIDVDELIKKYTTCADIDCYTCPIWECGCDGLLQILEEAPIIKNAKGGENERRNDEVD